MTTQEYELFKQNVESFFKTEGIDRLTHTTVNEPSFSHQPCECCGSPLGGNRYEMAGWNVRTRAVYGMYSVCVDCVQYIANGELETE